MNFMLGAFVKYLRLLIIIICTVYFSSCFVATGSMSFTNAKNLEKTFVSYDKSPDCSIDVFSVKSLPKESFYIIGTCKMEKREVNANRKLYNIEWLQSCACLAKGDAIIIGEFLEVPEKWYPTSPPYNFPTLQQPTTVTISVPSSNEQITVPNGNQAYFPDYAPSSSYQSQTITQDALSAKVIKYGVEERIY